MRATRLFLKNDAGVIAPATAVVMAVLIGMLGLVTDTSVWFAQRRQLQGVTDAAALAAARYALDPASATAAATAVLTSNGLDPKMALVSVQTGSYCPDSTVPVASRFQPAPATCPGSATSAGGAVRVSTTLNASLYLSQFFITGSRQITTTATAARVNQAGLQAGTGVASLNGGIANALLSALTGSTVSLTAVQYDGLLKTNVNGLTFLDALATRLNITAGTYSSLLNSNVGVGDVIAAEISALNQQQQTASVAAAVSGLTQLQGQIAGNQTIAVGKLFDLGLWSNEPIGSSISPSALNAGLNLYQLTSFSLQLADSNHAATIPSSSIGIPGLASITIAATAIEPPVHSYFAFGPVGTTVHTAQVRVKLNLQVLNLVPQLGVGVSVPLYVELGSGDAAITSISCSGSPATDATVGVLAHGGVANVYIGAPSDDAMNNFSAPVANSAIVPVKILNLGVPGLVTLATTTASAHLAVGSTTGPGTALNFVQPNGSNSFAPNPLNTTGVIGQPGTSGTAGFTAIPAEAFSTGFTGNLVGGLAQTLSANVCTASLLGACLLPVTVTGAGLGPLYTVLNPVLGVLDPVLDGILRSLGIRLGYVDVSVTGVRCGLPVLVS